MVWVEWVAVDGKHMLVFMLKTARHGVDRNCQPTKKTRDSGSLIHWHWHVRSNRFGNQIVMMFYLKTH